MISDDLMSLLDAGMHSDHPSVIIDSDAMFGEDMFGYSTLRTRSTSRGRSGMVAFSFKFCLNKLMIFHHRSSILFNEITEEIMS